MSAETILSLLLQAGDSPISGEKMCQQLGVSRAAIWKGVEKLRREGYDISSAPNRGYRLEGSPNTLSAPTLMNAMVGCTIGREIRCLPSVDSTNEEVKRLAAQGAPEGLVVISPLQTMGKGRSGRSFQSPQGGLYTSILLRPQCSIGQLLQITAWSAVAFAQGIKEATGLDIGIKWTNDLVLGNKKLGGILTELGLEGESGAINYVVVGIGINVAQQSHEFSPEVEAVATSLAQHLDSLPSYNAIATAMLKAFDQMYTAFPAAHDSYLQAYRNNCLTLGRPCRILRANQVVQEANAVDIDDDFGLIVAHEGGSRETLTSGEVSVRGLFGYLD